MLAKFYIQRGCCITVRSAEDCAFVRITASITFWWLAGNAENWAEQPCHIAFVAWSAAHKLHVIVTFCTVWTPIAKFCGRCCSCCGRRGGGGRAHLFVLHSFCKQKRTVSTSNIPAFVPFRRHHRPHLTRHALHFSIIRCAPNVVRPARHLGAVVKYIALQLLRKRRHTLVHDAVLILVKVALGTRRPLFVAGDKVTQDNDMLSPRRVPRRVTSLEHCLGLSQSKVDV